MAAVDNGTASGKKKIIDDNSHSLLDNLTNPTCDTSVKVRVARKWDTHKISGNKDFLSADMVLIDEKGNYLHASIEKHLAKKFSSLLEEGKIYVLKNFGVAPNKETFPIIQNNESMLLFRPNTVVTEEGCDENIIPHHAFEFFEFEKLRNRYGKEILSDVIGVIIDVTPIEEKITKYGKTNLMTVHLKNIKGTTIKVSLWDAYATMFEQQFNQNVRPQSLPNVGVFSSTIVKEFRDEYFVSSTSATRIYVNLDIPEATELIQSLKDKIDLHLGENMSIPRVDRVKTISEILTMAKSGDSKVGVYYCLATISEILTKNGWYYVCCPNCKKGASPTDVDFTCDKCHKKVDYPKTRVRLEIDVKDSTESTIFVLFGETAEELAQHKLGDLISEFENGNEDISNVPAQLRKLVGTTHVFQVIMKSYYEGKGRQSFTCGKVLKPIVKVEKEEKEMSSSSGSPTIKTPEKPQKRRRLRLQSEDESDNAEKHDFPEELAE